MCMRFRFSKFDGKGSVVAPISELRLRSPSDGAKSTRGVSVPWKTPSVRTSGTRVRSRFSSSRASYVNIVDSNMAGNNSGGSSMDGSDDSSKGDNSGDNKDDSSDGSKDDNNNDGNSDDNKDGNSDDNRGDDNSDGNSKLAERQF